MKNFKSFKYTHIMFSSELATILLGISIIINIRETLIIIDNETQLVFFLSSLQKCDFSFHEYFLKQVIALFQRRIPSRKRNALT